jgi:hypothetical protein
MNNWFGFRIFYPLFFALLLLINSSAVQAGSAQHEIARIIHLLGYGGAIHNFKNYVLRGEHRPEHGEIARRQFSMVLDIIMRLEKKTEMEHQAIKSLTDVRDMVEGYLSGLIRIKGLYEKGWRLEDIDRVVIVNDELAVKGLDYLRSKWQWQLLDEMEYQLGYGGAIHAFKNYVLRAKDSYFTHALEKFLVVESILSELSNQKKLTEEDKGNLATVERVIHAYIEYLSLIERLMRMHRPVRQIDLAVKINDRPALDALKQLREKLNVTNR